MGDPNDFYIGEATARPYRIVVRTAEQRKVRRSPDTIKIGDECAADEEFSLPLTIKNEMGQEDVLRKSGDFRVDNAGTGRIVVTTLGLSTIKKIAYTRNPADEDNPPLGKEWDVTSELKRRHEVFVPVSPSSLYAFQVTVEDKGKTETLTSTIQYFTTGSEVTIGAVSLAFIFLTKIEGVDKTVTEAAATFSMSTTQNIIPKVGSLEAALQGASTTSVDTTFKADTDTFVTLTSTSII